MIASFPIGRRTISRADSRPTACAAFTLIELLVVIAIIGVLAALIVGVAPKAFQSRQQSKVKTELEGLVTVIETYQSIKGFYPPDNPKDPAMSPLYYELTGVVEINRPNESRKFGDITGQELDTNEVQQAFNIPSFLNFGPDRQSVKNFYPSMPVSMVKEVLMSSPPTAASSGSRVKVLKTSAPGTNELQVNTWRYDSSSNNRHNAESFDLWVDTVLGGKTNKIGNWKE